MADKYIIHGSAFNGDGTSSAAATANGGVGAWNNINVFQGTAPGFGTLAGGDRVFVRSKDASGSDITINTATAISLGSSAATETGPITWVFDHGTVWPGVTGAVRYNGTESIAITIRDWNNIKAKHYNFVVANTLASISNVGALTLGTGWTEDVLCDLSACTSATGPFIYYKTSYHINFSVKSHGRYIALFRPVSSGNYSPTLYSPEIELLNPLELDPVFAVTTGYSTDPVTVYGGRIFGPGSTGGAPVFTAFSTAGTFRAFGLQYPREMPLSTPALMLDKVSGYADGADGDFGSEYFGYFYAFTSRSDNYPPTLNAYLETTSQQPWSYRLYPYRTTESNPAQISLSKTWTQAAAVKTITQELLWPTSMDAPTKDKVYLVVQYTDDSTGLPRSISTRDMSAASLVASTAAWTATTWGMVAFEKYKLSFTTPTPIKQDTAVLVTLFVVPRSATVNDVMFIDPDPVFS